MRLIVFVCVCAGILLPTAAAAQYGYPYGAAESRGLSGAVIAGIAVFWLVGAVVCSQIASAKGRSAWAGFAFAVFLSPVMAWGFYVAVPALPPGSQLAGVEPARAGVAVPRGGAWTCPRCEARNEADKDKCPSCALWRPSP